MISKTIMIDIVIFFSGSTFSYTFETEDMKTSRRKYERRLATTVKIELESEVLTHFELSEIRLEAR